MPVPMDASAPRFTARFFGPRGVATDTARSIFALVEATLEIRPPNAGEPRNTLVLEAEKLTPAVMSSPPMVIEYVPPRAACMAEPGRVKFKPVALLGSIWILAVAVTLGNTVTD
jgi:hypothetical protein